MVETAVVHAGVHHQVRCALAFRKKPDNTTRKDILNRHGCLYFFSVVPDDELIRIPFLLLRNEVATYLAGDVSEVN